MPRATTRSWTLRRIEGLSAEADRAYLVNMNRLLPIMLLCAVLGGAAPALAQGTVTLPGSTIPLPLPPQMPPSTVPAPGAPKTNTFSDRAVQCIHHGTASGVGPAQIGQYTRECVNAR